jgi:hypothetical protein
METSLLFDGSRTNELEKSIMPDLLQSSQELDIQVINFVVMCLLPNCVDAPEHASSDQRSFEQNLVQIIDTCCNNNQQTYGQNVSGGIKSSSTNSNNQGGTNLSRYCFNNLFELCR